VVSERLIHPGSGIALGCETDEMTVQNALAWRTRRHFSVWRNNLRSWIPESGELFANATLRPTNRYRSNRATSHPSKHWTVHRPRPISDSPTWTCTSKIRRSMRYHRNRQSESSVVRNEWVHQMVTPMEYEAHRRRPHGPGTSAEAAARFDRLLAETAPTKPLRWPPRRRQHDRSKRHRLVLYVLAALVVLVVSTVAITF